MNQLLIRYQTKPGQAEANAGLIRAVYAELHQAQPDGLAYAAFRLSDGVTFLHLVQAEHTGDASPLRAIRAFGEFQAGIRERCVAPPSQETLTEIGSYRVFGG
jgi:hypothetical protein